MDKFCGFRTYYNFCDYNNYLPRFLCGYNYDYLGIALVYEGISGLTLIATIGHYAKKISNESQMINITPDNEYDDD